MRMGHRGVQQPGMVEARAGKIGPVEPGAAQLAVVKPRAGKILAAKIGAVKVASFDEKARARCGCPRVSSCRQNVNH